MVNKSNYSRKANVSIKISEFELPPMQDIMIIGRRAPVGSEAVRRMAEALSPEQFTIIKIEHPDVEGVLVRNSLLNMLDQNLLLELILEEADRLISDHMVLRAELKISISIQREVELK